MGSVEPIIKVKVFGYMVVTISARVYNFNSVKSENQYKNLRGYQCSWKMQTPSFEYLLPQPGFCNDLCLFHNLVTENYLTLLPIEVFY